jgi:ribosomal-protein-alanine N-acetyltransferase
MNAIPFNIRRLKAQDLPDVMGLDRVVFKEPWPESAYIQELYFNPQARYFVLHREIPAEDVKAWQFWRARHTARLIGFLGMRIEMNAGHISTIAVHPQWQGRKLGEWLLITALEQAFDDQARAMTLEVRVSNTRAQHLYRKYDFAVTSRLHEYYQDSEDAYVMRVAPLDRAYQAMVATRRQEVLAYLALQTA